MDKTEKKRFFDTERDKITEGNLDDQYKTDEFDVPEVAKIKAKRRKRFEQDWVRVMFWRLLILFVVAAVCFGVMVISDYIRYLDGMLPLADKPMARLVGSVLIPLILLALLLSVMIHIQRRRTRQGKIKDPLRLYKYSEWIIGAISALFIIWFLAALLIG